MNKQVPFFLIFSIISILLTTCFKEEYAQMKKQKDFVGKKGVSTPIENKDAIIELIRNIPTETGLTIVWDYKNSKSFKELEKMSDDLLDIAFFLFEDSELTLDEKVRFAYAIQNVEFENYKYFIHDLALGFRDGKIEEYLIDICIFPRDGWNYMVIKNYKDPIIRDALNIVLKNAKISFSLRLGIKSVLSGRELKRINRSK